MTTTRNSGDDGFDLESVLRELVSKNGPKLLGEVARNLFSEKLTPPQSAPENASASTTASTSTWTAPNVSYTVNSGGGGGGTAKGSESAQRIKDLENDLDEAYEILEALKELNRALLRVVQAFLDTL